MPVRLRSRPSADAWQRKSLAEACVSLQLPGPGQAMAKKSAGMLLWKRTGEGLRFLLVHPGGPFWRNKDQGAWSLPKGEYDDSEDALAAAKRELVEELGPAAAPAVARQDAAFIPLGEVKQKGGKVVTAFALEGDFDVTQLASNTFEIEWPPK